MPRPCIYPAPSSARSTPPAMTGPNWPWVTSIYVSLTEILHQRRHDLPGISPAAVGGAGDHVADLRRAGDPQVGTTHRH